ncbi:hypothetical protein [Streptomyces sp. NPDC057854]|uniref:hypothetical protein n=1 Tax=unclassified Streptomyces TaxID=2593676 RepID=UPI0036C018E5
MNWPLIRRVVTDAELREGKHVHTENYSHSEMCQGGDPECPLWQAQLEEAMEAWS